MKRKIKYKNIFILVGIIAFIIFSICFIKRKIYENSYEYKFLTIGYQKEDVEFLLTLEDDKLDYLLTLEYNDKIIPLFKEEYFMYKNLDRYLNYDNKKNYSYKDIVAIINTNADQDWYSDDYIKETNIEKGYAMLVNKFNYLPDNYDPNIVNIKNWYAYGDQKIDEEVLDNYLDMYNAAKEEGLSLIVNSSYRSYQEQKDIYDEFKDVYGSKYAEEYAARPNYSEHQTGFALDLFTEKYATTDTFDQSEEFAWLIKNSYKYGFILRYPKDKEYITGYNYESWHFRYLGKELAKKVYDSNLTYDEYYAYYIEGV